MAALPTLLLKGKLQAPDGDPVAKRALDEFIPIEYILEWFRSRMSKTGPAARVLILKSETASGKSTVVASEIFKAFVRGATGANATRGIICTQPRILTAVENVTEILAHYSKVMRLGESIGYSTKSNRLKPKRVGLLSATIGTLTQQMRVMSDDDLMSLYRFILIDETHERDLNTDMTIYMLKNLIMRQRNNIACPFVVLMSATFDPVRFLDYFGVELHSNFIWCVGEAAGFDEKWDWNGGRTVNNYPQAAADVVRMIIKENPDDPPPRADILIFMPGAAEFKACVEWLTRLNEEIARGHDGSGTVPPPVFSILQIERTAVQTRNVDYMRTMYIPVTDYEITIAGAKYTPRRRVVISTNIAETGVTLNNLKYVIDAGYNRETEYNPIWGIRGLITKPAPRSRIRQRKGRAGRKFRGVFYPLYPQYIYDRLPEFQLPQILIDDILPITLDIITLQLGVKAAAGDSDPQFSIKDIDMVDVPAPDALAGALEKLYTLGLISPRAPRWGEHLPPPPSTPTNPHPPVLSPRVDVDRLSITRLGTACQKMTLVPESARMILSAYYWDVAPLDMVTIAAYLMLDSATIAEGPAGTIGPVEVNWTPVYRAALPAGILSPTNLAPKLQVLIADEFIHGLLMYNAIKRTLASADKVDPAGELRRWCVHASLSYRACLDLVRLRDEIIEQLLGEGFELFTSAEGLYNVTADAFMDTIARMKHCIYDGYRNNLLVRVGGVTGAGEDILGGAKSRPKAPPRPSKAASRASKPAPSVGDGKPSESARATTPSRAPPKTALVEYRTMNGLRVLIPRLISGNTPASAAAPRALVYKELSLKYNLKTGIYDVRASRVSCLDGFVSPDVEFATFVPQE